ncbi:hypothetical protein KOR42_08820 [Thalassoglobus neptunius]|uniref:Uncharacterized protein n=1 Tax=Thalassoglobus neptunius TaxID=1938619 RepID=A0A5C5X5B7_9PLAN|nr:hypothetical protein KOR42_08820 [Thalassoglobus neptunius]
MASSMLLGGFSVPACEEFADLREVQARNPQESALVRGRTSHKKDHRFRKVSSNGFEANRVSRDNCQFFGS